MSSTGHIKGVGFRLASKYNQASSVEQGVTSGVSLSICHSLKGLSAEMPAIYRYFYGIHP